MQNSRFTILSKLMKDNTPLPTPISSMVVSYLAFNNLPDYIASFYLEKNPSHAKEIAKICLEKLATPHEESKDTKRNRVFPVRADGVANALCALDDDKINFLFIQWEILANSQESEAKEPESICSSYRLLIAYYLPTPALLTDMYGMNKVRAYLAREFIELPEHSLIHALKIKFAIANEDHPERINSLLDISTTHLNLFAANLSYINYSFGRRNLSFACLKDVILDEKFITRLPSSLISANLQGAHVKPNFKPNLTTRLIDTMTQAQGGLDIVYGPQKNTLLHFYASNSINYHRLVQKGADTRKKNTNNKLPYQLALMIEEDKDDSSYEWINFSDDCKWLFQSLANEELLELKRHSKEQRWRLLISSTKVMLGIIAAITIVFATIALSIFASASATGILWLLEVAPGFLIACIIGTIVFVAPEFLLAIVPALSFISISLVQGLLGFISINKVIDRQLAINANPDNKIHALLYKKSKLGDESLSEEENISLESLTASDLERAKVINNQVGKNEIYASLSWFLKTLLFASVTATAAACFLIWTHPLCLVVSLGSPAWIGGAAAAASSNVAVMYTGALGGIFSLWNVFTSLAEGLYYKWEVDTLINAKLTAREPDEPEQSRSPSAALVCVSDSKSAPSPVVKAASVSPGRVSALSLLSGTNVQKEDKEQIYNLDTRSTRVFT